MKADDLATSDAERRALSLLREATGETGGPMERHSLRLYLLSDKMATERGEEVDREVLFVACMLHDVGLYDTAARGGAYVLDGAEFTDSMLTELGWDEERRRLCFDAIERHHEVRPQWKHGTEVELVRRADLIDLTRGLIRFRLRREWVKDLFGLVPRDGVYSEVSREVAKAARERPLTLPKIFIRRG